MKFSRMIVEVNYDVYDDFALTEKDCVQIDVVEEGEYDSIAVLFNTDNPEAITIKQAKDLARNEIEMYRDSTGVQFELSESTQIFTDKTLVAVQWFIET